MIPTIFPTIQTTSSSTTQMITQPVMNNIQLSPEFELDSDFVLLIYNARILQYQNLMSLQRLAENFYDINLRLVNLTYISVF